MGEAASKCSKVAYAGQAAAHAAHAAAEAFEAELMDDNSHVGLRQRMHQRVHPVLKENKEKTLVEVKKEEFVEKVRDQINEKREEVITALDVTTGGTPLSNQRSSVVRRGSVGAGAVLPAEVDRLGHRAHVVVSGKLAQVPERPFEMKMLAMRGLGAIEELAEDHNAGVKCVNGSSPAFVRPNQDDFFFAVTSDLYRIGAVVDGHGSDGHIGSAIVRDALLRTLLGHLPWSNEGTEQAIYVVNMRDAMTVAFERASQILMEHEEFDPRLSGVCACVAIHDVKRQWLHVAWVGNCRCVVADLQDEEVSEESPSQSGAAPKRKVKQTKKNLVAVPLTLDHTTKNEEERRRVEQAGAEFREVKGCEDEIVAPGESLPGIPLTRCLGNLVSQQLGVNDQIQTYNRAIAPPGKDARFLILLTDGVSDVMRNSEVIATMNEAKKDNMEFALKHVVDKAHNAWVKKAHRVGNVIDDITVVAIWLKGTQAKALDKRSDF